VSAERVAESALRCLERALDAMNHAVTLTRDLGPAVAMEYIADFLNDTDGIDEAVVDATPDNWLTQWQVARVEVQS
jgi:hypothetical protein